MRPVIWEKGIKVPLPKTSVRWNQKLFGRREANGRGKRMVLGSIPEKFKSFCFQVEAKNPDLKRGWNFSWIKTKKWEGGRSLQPGPETVILNHHRRGHYCSTFPARLEPRWTWVCKNILFFFFFQEKNWQGFPDTSYVGKRGQPRATEVEPTYIKADFGFGYLSKLSLQRFWCCPIV